MAATWLESPFVRQAELEDIHAAISGEHCRAVFLSYDTGLGATTILRQLALEAGRTRAVLTINGTSSLAAVPYGALAPFLRGVRMENLGLRTQALRAVLAAIEERKVDSHGDKSGPALIIVDDAHAVDPSTAELLVSLALAGSVRLVASHLVCVDLPQPLPHLWSAGVAENIEMAPLTREQAHEFCRSLLQGQVAMSTSWFFWSAASGNPLLLKLLISQAHDDGLLARNRGTWVYHHGQLGVGRNLRDTVLHQIRGLTHKAEAALDLAALAAPVSLLLVQDIYGEHAVEELMERKLVQLTGPDNDWLQLASPIYGDVLRNMVSPGRRRILFDQLSHRLDVEPFTTESLLRRVLWELDCGLVVADEQLLQAALTACKLSQPLVSLDLLGRIAGPGHALRIAAVKARAEFLRGNYQRAATLLEDSFVEAESLDDLIFASLLRGATKMALGMPASSLDDEIEQLTANGSRLARQSPDHAADISAIVDNRAKLLRLMRLSQTGDYRAMEPLIASLKSETGVPEDERKLIRTFALTMEAERLCAQGRVLESQQRSREAFAIEHRDNYDIFFLPEMIIFRQLAVALTAGDLLQAQQLLEQFFVDAGPVILTFGGSANVGRGMGYVRQGLFEHALEVLLPGMESLRVTDPQQLLGFCTALAAYSAAQLEDNELAAGLLADYQEMPGMFLVTSHERAFAAAAREHLTHDGVGLAELLTLADDSLAAGSTLLELNALVLAVELGDLSQTDRLLDAAGSVEGAWSASVVDYVKEVLEREPEGKLEGENGNDSGRAGTPAAAHWPTLRDAPAGSGAGASEPRIEIVGIPNHVANRSTKAGGPSTGNAHNAEWLALGKLTNRESQIVRMAAKGLSDRAIALKLHLSLRTIEGHLYRAYSKLGITGRDELAPLLSASPQR